MLFLSCKKLFFFLRYLNFCPKSFYYAGKRFDKKAKVNLKSMTSQPGKHIIRKHILPHISRCKVNLTMRFGQLIEYNMRNIFLV